MTLFSIQLHERVREFHRIITVWCQLTSIDFNTFQLDTYVALMTLKEKTVQGINSSTTYELKKSGKSCFVVPYS